MCSFSMLAYATQGIVYIRQQTILVLKPDLSCHACILHATVSVELVEMSQHSH